MKQILRNGKTVEVADDYALQSGETWAPASAGTDGWKPCQPNLGKDEDVPEGVSTEISGGETDVPLNKEFKVIDAKRTYRDVNGTMRVIYILQLAFKDGSSIRVSSAVFTRTLRNIVGKDADGNSVVNTTATVSARTLRPDGTNGRLIGQVFAGATSGKEVVEKCSNIIFKALDSDRRICRYGEGESARDSSAYVVCAVEVA